MSDNDKPEQDKVQDILSVLLRLANAELDARIELSGGDTPLDLVATAVNMLGEELQASVTAERELRRNLEREVAQRTAELEALEEAQALVAQQNAAIRELSTPVIEILTGILILPLVGIIDSSRGEQIMDQLLESITRTGAKVTIIDVTGVPTIDTMVAEQLLSAVSASKLLGTEAVLTGLSADNAQTLVSLGVEFEDMITASSLKGGLRRALAVLERAG